MDTYSFFLQGLLASSLHPTDPSWPLHGPHIHTEPCTTSHLGHPAGVLDLLIQVHEPKELLPNVLSGQLLLQEDSHHGSHSPEDRLFVLERDGRGPASKTEGLPFLETGLSLSLPLPHTPVPRTRWARSGGQGAFPPSFIPSSPCYNVVTCNCFLAGRSSPKHKASFRPFAEPAHSLSSPFCSQPSGHRQSCRHGCPHCHPTLGNTAMLTFSSLQLPVPHHRAGELVKILTDLLFLHGALLYSGQVKLDSF